MRIIILILNLLFMAVNICQNLVSVQNRISEVCERAGRNPEEVQLVAVSKMKPLDNIKTAFGCGQLHFGENRARELQDKIGRASCRERVSDSAIGGGAGEDKWVQA